ncbi:RST domain of plant C-terminal [Macleaya cordata]|uniref:RST domain of plant C-terminal n=1 Tax=Macleaya cordata TaxID=56857 RepID=A0A200R320_MACCD|nr:RST domain of plant C-terminal [Macleaya cordata]
MMSRNQQGLKNSQPQGRQHSSELDWAQHGSGVDSQQQQNNCSLEHNQLLLQQNQSHDDQLKRQAEQNAPQFSQKNAVQISEQNTAHMPEQQDRMRHPDNQHPFPKLQKMNNQQAPQAEQANNPLSRNKQVPFGMLLPAILPHLDKDRNMQLQTFVAKLKSNEINKDELVRLMRSIVGDKMLRVAEMAKDQAAINSQTGPLQFQIHSQVPSTTTPLGAGTNVKTPPKKPSIGEKKPLDALGAPSSVADDLFKTQKLFGAFLDQSIGQLNDVTAVNGVNIKVMGHERPGQVLGVPIGGEAKTVRGEPSTAASSRDDQVRTLREEVDMRRRDHEERLRKEEQLEESLRSTREHLERLERVMRVVLQSTGYLTTTTATAPAPAPAIGMFIEIIVQFRCSSM